MTDASRTHRRVVVAAIAAVLATIALVPLATTARAANVNSQATGITLAPRSDAATVGTCNPFTATVIPDPNAGDSYTVTVTISQQAAQPSAPSGGGTQIGFCDVSKFDPAAGANQQPNPATSTGSASAGGVPVVGQGGDGTASGGQTLCGRAYSSPTPGAPATSLTCTATYSTDSAGKVTFGVTSDTPGSMTVQTYVDKGGNGKYDAGVDPFASSSKTWAANDAGGITCASSTTVKPVSSAYTFVCKVTTTGGTPGAGGTPVKFNILNGPDQGNTDYTCTYDTNAANKGQYGNYNCAFSNNGQSGTDTLAAWTDVDNDGNPDSGEPATQASVAFGNVPPPTITYSQPNKTAGQNVTFSGTTGSDSGTVTLEYKNVTTGGTYKPLATVTPNSSGQWTYGPTPISYITTVRATNAAGSSEVTVRVNVKVTIDSIRYLGKDTRGKCVTRFLGGTYPFIPGAPVWIRNSAVSPTQPIGYSKVFQFGASGRYDVRFGLNCGQTYRLFSLISGTSSTGVKYTDNGVGTDRTYKAGTNL